ncbi:uncharacterized protein LOC129761179 [Toxorhynchites rutilus septentrionalis]|uniref:uncharacterized protein LOC129761179 n=1 Tax=Toxorhynchites rutilus septentrionalis TaxID=329112 RepID=UPI00247AF3CF|nr:uncharacterized protein LOC129761179 [Toxorhynchites rutilus septentrionalis]
MVDYDVCGQWYHFVCAGVDSSIQDRDWSCETCVRAAVQIPVGTSTPISTGATAKSANSERLISIPDVQMQIASIQEKLNSQLMQFEKLLMEKDQHQKTLSNEREKYERQLESMKHQVQEREELKQKAVCGGTASSTRFLPPLNANENNEPNDLLTQKLQLLEKRQALENKHLEERRQLLQRFHMIDRGVVESDPELSAFQPIDRSNLQRVCSLSQSQISARQGISSELPTFSGYPEEWPLFIASYENSTRICGYSDEENLLRLQRSLKGKALEAVRCRLLYPSSLSGTIATLRTLFGRPEIIVHSLINNIREMPVPKAEELHTLIDFGVAVQNICATIKASGLEEYSCNVALLQELVERLPPSIRLNWTYHRQTLSRVTLSNLGDWLEKLVEAASTVTIPFIGIPNPEGRGRRDSCMNIHSDIHIEEFSPRIRTGPIVRGCPACKEECSSLESCHVFLNMDIGTRWNVVKERKLCRKCLRKHFGACNIRTPCGKNGCFLMHSELLHDDRRHSQPAPELSTSISGQTTSQNCHTHSNNVGNVLFRYVPVTIYGKGKTIKTFAFLDDGSSATFMEHSLMRELNLEEISHPLCLNWTGSQQREENESVKLTVKISGVCDVNKVYELPNVHTVRSLALPKQSVPVPQLAAKYRYLKGLPLKSYANVSPRLLIGMDNSRLGHILTSVEGTYNEPIASETRLGWIVYGPCSMTSGSTNTDYNSFHSFHICQCSKEAKKDLTVTQEYLVDDSLGILDPESSKDEVRVLNTVSPETRLKENRCRTDLSDKALSQELTVFLEKRLQRGPALATSTVAKEGIEDFP